MPIVPYKQTVDAVGTPSASFSHRADAGAFGPDMSGLAKGVASAVDDYAKVVVHEEADRQKKLEEAKAKADETKVLEAFSAYSDDVETGRNAILTNLKGALALDAPDAMGKVLKESAAKHEASLVDDAQRLAFGKLRIRTEMNLRQEAARHSSAEFRDYQQGQSAGFLAKVGNNVARYATTNANASAAALQSGIEHLEQSPLYAGDSPEERSARIAKFKSGALAGAVNEMVANGNYTMATDFLKKNEGRFLRDDYTTLLSKVQPSADVAEAHQEALKVFETATKNMKDDDVVDLAKMESEINTKWAGSPKKAELAITKIRDLTAARAASIKAREDARTGSVALAIQQGATRSEVEAMSDYLGSNSGTKAALLKAQAEHSYTTDTRAAEETSARLELTFANNPKALLDNPDYSALPWVNKLAIANHLTTKDQAARDLLIKELTARETILRYTKADEYLRLSDPSVLMTMTPDQIKAKLPVLGMGYTFELVQKREQYEKDGKKLAAGQIDNDDFYSLAGEAKVDLKDKVTIADIKSAVETKIVSFQKAKGEELSREEKKDLMRNELVKVTVKANRTLTNWSPSMEKSLYDVKYQQNITDSSKVVVPAWADRIIRKRAAGMGKTLTNDQVKVIYLQMGRGQ